MRATRTPRRRPEPGAALPRQAAHGHTGGGCTRTRRFRALGHDFAVRAPDVALVGYLDEVWAPFAVAGEPREEYRVRAMPGEEAARWELWHGDECVAPADEPSMALAMLLWHVNRQVVARSPELVRVHAAAASLDGDAVVLPAPMESGKTTLVAGLVRAGLRYLSDEVAAVEPDTLTVRAYPKPLSLDPGSWAVLADLEPQVDPAVTPWLPAQWQVPATAIRADALARTASPRLIVFPRYEAGAAATLTPLSRADALVALVHSTFDFAAQPARDLDTLARLTRRCDAYELVSGDLDAACAQVREALLARRAGPPPALPPLGSRGAS